MLQIIPDYNANQNDNNIVRTGIIDFNESALKFKSKSISIFLKDSNKKVHGGILTWLNSDSIYIDVLWIDEKFRQQGYGTKLLQAAENEGSRHSCRFCMVDTFGFQAEEFYQNHGYEMIGEIKNYVQEYSRIFFRKNLTPLV